MSSRCCEFVDSRLRRSPPDRASAVPYGQAGENAMRFPHLAHRSAAAHKLHSTPQQDRMNLISGKGETSSRLPGPFSLFLPGSCPNNRNRCTGPGGPTSWRQNKGSHACRQRIRSPEPLPKLDLRLPTAAKAGESPLSRSSKYHLDGNLRISRALSIGLICARYRILALCQSRSSWRPTETRDDTFMGPGKQRISERSLWWTVKRKDTTNSSLD